jgi:hypothetical protein
MFNDLFWALYLIDILQNIGGALVGGSLITGLICVGPCAYYVLEKEEAVPKLWLYGIPSIIICSSLLLAAIPSKQTMYMMLGVRATENFTQTEMGKKLEAYINGQMDEFLNKGKEK